MKLYIAVHNFFEIYTAYLGDCSDNKAIIEISLDKWIKTESKYGSDAKGFVAEVEINDHLLSCSKDVVESGGEVRFSFDVDVEEFLDSNKEVYAIKINKVNKIVSAREKSDRIFQAVYRKY